MLLMTRARRMNEESQELQESATETLKLQRDTTSEALSKLGHTRFELYDGSLRRFVAAFEKLKAVEATPLSGEFPLGEKALPTAELREISFDAIDGLKTALASGGAGAAAGAAAWVTVGALGTASTGTAIATLGGAAATNATLAWFGGGALAAGGAGVTVGMAVLGGIIVAPALVVAAFLIHTHGKKELEKAKANRAEVAARVADIDAMTTVARGIEQRAKHLDRVLRSLSKQFEPMVAWLEELVHREDDYGALGDETRQQLYVATTTAVTLRHALDVGLIDEDGSLTQLSGEVLSEATKLDKQLRQSELPSPVS